MTEPPIKRAGISVDENGNPGYLPFWPDRFQNATGWVAALGRERTAVLNIAQKRHLQNQAVRTAKITRQPAQLPEPDVRAKIARTEQKQLAQIHHKAAQVADEVFLKKTELRNKALDNGPSLVDAMNRAELRSALRSMPDKQRIDAMKNFKFRNAALEQPAALSGLPENLHADLIEETMRAKFPQDMTDLADAQEAIELLQETLKPATKAVQNELRAAGAPLSEPSEPEPAKPWA